MKFFKKILIFLLIIVLIGAGILAYFKVQRLIYPEEYSIYVTKYSEKYDVDTQLVYAVIKCESSFEPNAVSSVGAIGLMQLTEDTFDWVQSKYKQSDYYDGEPQYTADDLYSPEINIKYGTYLLKLHLREFGDVKTALAAYHAGRGNANGWLENSDYSKDGKTLVTTPYKETNAYMQRVVEVRDKYDFLMNNKYIVKLRELKLL